MHKVIRFDDRIWLFWAILVLLLPLEWLAAAAFSAVVHEICHVILIRLLGGNICRITVKPFGAVIDTMPMDTFREMLSAAAGPAGSILLSFCMFRFPILGICALVQGLFNCLPVYPLDGGRIVRCLLELTISSGADKIFRWIEGIVLIFLFGMSVYLAQRFSLGFFPVFFCIFVIVKALLRKRP